MTDAIKVCLRFRPMNKVESQEDGNHICVKLSGCRRAVRIDNNELSEHGSKHAGAHMFNFDQIYPPGATQEAVYKYTGRPLVQNTLNGFNSTLFAYGQTGSGKTHSMMGVAGNDELEGIVPRVIKDLFQEIESMETEDEYSISMSMCEIYLNKVKDLLNNNGKNLKIRMDENNSVFVEGIEQVFVQGADEVVDRIDAGNLNRATSSTRMNNQSSRSHCIIILNVICKQAGGGTRVSKVKMIDLAGSETTKKTGATDQRLEEAKCINSSLSALNGVLKALSGKEGEFVPFRNSPLTRLLQDSLGGNAKTSLLLAASPCSYNRDESVSTLRFGERAKKVQNRAVINEELSIDEYKKRNKLLAAENEALKNLLQVRDGQMGNCVEWLESHDAITPDNWKLLTDESQFGAQTATEAIDMNNMTFNEVSAEMSVLDRRTGKLICGNRFAVDIDGTPTDVAEEKQRNFRGMLTRQLTVSGAVEQQIQVTELTGTLADLEAELKAESRTLAHYADLLDTAEGEIQSRDRQLEKVEMELREGAVYKQKCTFLQEQMECEMSRLQAHLEYFQMEEDEMDKQLMDDDSTGTHDSRHDSAMMRRVRRQEELIRKLKVEAGKGGALADSLVQNIVMADMDDDRREAIKTLIAKFGALKAEVKLMREEAEKQKRKTALVNVRERATEKLKDNWRGQLASMETAVMHTMAAYKKDKVVAAHREEDLGAKVAQLEQRVNAAREARTAMSKVSHGKKRGIRRRVSPNRKSGQATGNVMPILNKLKSLSPKKRRPRRRGKSMSPQPTEEVVDGLTN
jgi:kinesin family protein 5